MTAGLTAGAMTSNLNLLTNADSNLVLTGYTGPNQPAVGRALAERLNLKLVNVDDRVEDLADMTLDEIRSMFGQARLKDLENEVVNEILLNRGSVIRVSGEALAHGNNLERFVATGPVICLVAALDAVMARQHLAMGNRYHNPAERAVVVGELRRAWSVRGKPGVFEIDATYLNTDETIAAVVRLWQDVALQRG
ncbi:MAG: shikimate kinase [Chloroflexota bacterium]